MMFNMNDQTYKDYISSVISDAMQKLLSEQPKCSKCLKSPVYFVGFGETSQENLLNPDGTFDIKISFESIDNPK